MSSQAVHSVTRDPSISRGGGNSSVAERHTRAGVGIAVRVVDVIVEFEEVLRTLSGATVELFVSFQVAPIRLFQVFQLNHIDAYIVHRDSPQVPMEVSAETVKSLMRAGVSAWSGELRSHRPQNHLRSEMAGFGFSGFRFCG